MNRRRQALLIAVVGTLAAVLAASFAAAEKATVVRAGNLVLRINGGVSPKKLPKNKLAPITLRASGRLSTTDGSQPPATKTVTIDFDKHGTINARGLPVCHAGQLQSRDTKSAKAACPKSIVGHGKTIVRVAFPEQTPFQSTGPLILFNGGVRHGVTTMYIHAYVSVPTPTAIVTVVKIKKIHKGPYGTRAMARIPKIAGGAGSVTSFTLAVHRTFKRGGKKQSYLLARCANGRFRAHAVLRAADGTTMGGSIVRSCRQSG